MVITVVFSVGAGMAYRKKFFGSTPLFYLIIASLVIPSILVSLGVGLIFSQLDWEVHWSTSGLGAQLTWTLPFGILIMFAVFNRFDKAYEEAGRFRCRSNSSFSFDCAADNCSFFNRCGFVRFHTEL